MTPRKGGHQHRARRLADHSIVDTIRCALEKHGIPGSAVDVEITETAAMQNTAAGEGE